MRQCRHMMSVTLGSYQGIERLLGCAAGFGLQGIAVCGALGLLLARWPHLAMALQWLGIGSALYLGWQTLHSRTAGGACNGGPATFCEVAARQFLNPRAWLICLVAATLLLPAPLQRVLTGGFPGTI